MDTKIVETKDLFETDRMDLAALLICRGLTFVGARTDDKWKHFQFEGKEKGDEIKHEYEFSNPTVKLHDYEAAKRRLNRIVHS